MIVLFFILGLMSKPMLVTLPFVLLLMDYWPLGRLQIWQSDNKNHLEFQKASIYRLVWEKIPLLALAVVASIVTFIAQQKGGSVQILDALPLLIRVSNALIAYVGYIGKMLWP
jgi:hypothetical protein